MIASGPQDVTAKAGRLLHAREYIGLTVQDVSAVLGIPPDMLDTFESGQAEPDEPLLRRLAQLYQRSLDYLLHGGAPRSTAPDQLAFLARDKTGLSAADLEEVQLFANFLDGQA
ncbi:helix-turn-helix domain-containing protein [Pseudomonas weihenstephanensis]|uniref:helix-turn-helix domain-containing protein n=1 Tax=Pseudomonas weihenstephanensis TaxID=1608994 RepID=UPI00193C7A56|nr:helix-turn-helix transcriptional regulator [Pseudomonas weihenstephanensis]MBM1191295.1 helix-turn-helix transcriptional regulator [Pseudomonas weihenstephanensis]